MLFTLGLLCFFYLAATAYQSSVKLSDRAIALLLMPVWVWLGTFSLLLIGGVFSTI